MSRNITRKVLIIAIFTVLFAMSLIVTATSLVYGETAVNDHNVTLISQVKGVQQTEVANLTQSYDGKTNKVTVSAENSTSGRLVFIGWYESSNNELGNFVSSKKTYTFTYKENYTLIALYRVNTDADSISITVNGEKREGVLIFDTVTLTSADQDFLYWRDLAGNIVSRSKEFSFVALKDDEYTSVTKSDGGIQVTFFNKYGFVLQSDLYTDKGISLPTTNPSYRGCEFKSWLCGDTEISGDDGLKACLNAMKSKGLYEAAIYPTYTNRTSEGGTFTIHITQKCGDNTQPYDYTDNNNKSEFVLGDIKEIEANPEYAGQRFSYWSRDNGETAISDNPKHKVTSMQAGTVNLTAVYGSKPVAVSPNIDIIQKYAAQNGEKYKLSSSFQYYVPSDCVLVDAGFLYGVNSDFETNSGSMTCGAENVYSKSSALKTAEGLYTLNMNVSVKDQVVYLKAYLKYLDDNKEVKTIYSGMEVVGYSLLNNKTAQNTNVEVEKTEGENPTIKTIADKTELFVQKGQMSPVNAWVTIKKGSSVNVNEDAVSSNAAKLTLVVTNDSADNPDVSKVQDEAMKIILLDVDHQSKAFDIKVDGLKEDNDQLVIGYLDNPLPSDVAEFGIYHVIGGEYTLMTEANSKDLSEDNTYFLDPNTGYLWFAVKHFSNFTINYLRQTYAITYEDCGEGVVNDNPTSYYPGKELKLNNPTREGYTFDGWYLGDKKISAISAKQTGNITLKACWKSITEVNILFENRDKYRYRVGNINTVPVNKLFGISVSGKHLNAKPDSVEINTVAGATGTYDNTNGELSFTGSGVVKLVAEYQGVESEELQLEVVDAKNITSAESATANSVVLLNDCSMGQNITIENGNYFYGNGFKIACTSSGSRNAATGMGEGFVNVKTSGVLDNTQVVCKVFPKGYLFSTSGLEYVKESENEIPNNPNHYNYQWSAVVANGDVEISNCFIYGARNNILTMGSPTIRNTVCECGSFANIQITGSNSDTVTLENVTTSQNLVNDDFEAGKFVMGFGIVLGSGDAEKMTTESNPSLIVEGDFKQYNWVSNEQRPDHSKVIQNLLDVAFKITDYVHVANETSYLNTGIVYLNSMTDTQAVNISGYTKCEINFSVYKAYVFSNQSNVGTVEKRDFKTEYVPSNQSSGIASIRHPNVAFEKSFENGKYVYKYTVPELANGESFDFDTEQFIVVKDGVVLSNNEYVIKDDSQNIVTGIIQLQSSGTHTYSITIPNDDKKYEISFVVTKKDIPVPEITNELSCNFEMLGSSNAGSVAYDCLSGLQVKYYSTNEQKIVEKKATEIFEEPEAGKINNTNTLTLEKPGELKIVIVSSGGHHSGENGGSGNPYYVSKNYYFAGTNGSLTSSSQNNRKGILRFTINDYVHSDKDAIKKEYTIAVNNSGKTFYDINKFKNGKLEEASSSSECLTPDTLITMADGSHKRIDQLSVGDEIMTFDHIKGCESSSPVAYIFKSHLNYPVTKLRFANGTEIKVLQAHCFYDQDKNKYVEVNQANVADYVGHKFYNMESKNFIELISYELYNEEIDAYSVLSEYDINHVANGYLAVSDEIEGLFNYFDYDKNMKYDPAKMKADIDKYISVHGSLVSYDMFADYCTKEEFDVFNCQYLGIAVEKGLTTFESLAERMIRFSGNSQ